MMKQTAKDTVIILCAIIFAVSTAWTQGVLMPPGPPEKTMKSLDQVEPRIPLAGGSSMVAITNSGSYYLTGNLYQTLAITTDSVTVDLMGYTISAGAMNAIDILGPLHNLVIRNGILKGSSIGLDAPALRNSASRFENLTVVDNTAAGIRVGSGCTIANCILERNAVYGIRLELGSNSVVRGCRISRNTAVGLEVVRGGACVEDNHIENNGTVGLRVKGSGSYIHDNIVKGNFDNYDFDMDNQINLLLSEIPETLEWPCSVKLTGTLICTIPATNGITVAADNVLLNLAGHAIISLTTGISGSGVRLVDGYSALRVRDGMLRGWDAIGEAGLRANGFGVVVERVHSRRNYYGFLLGNRAQVSQCIAQENLDVGISLMRDGQVRESTSVDNGVTGITVEDGSQVEGCVATLNRHDGIMAATGCLVRRCTVQSNSLDGIFAPIGCQITDCVAEGNGEDGLEVISEGTIRNCTARNNGRTGINIIGTGNTADGNTVTLSGSNPAYSMGSKAGIMVVGSNNLIIRNWLSMNASVDFNVNPGNQIGLVMPPPLPTTPGVVGSAGGGFGATDPFANITY